MKPQHTAEPWHATGEIVRKSLGNTGILDCNTFGRARSTGECQANAQRIVDCVNACAGLNPAAVPELIEALVSVVKTCEAGVIHVNETGKPQWSALDQMKQIARNALAKSKSKTP
jgi:hypothetical protein